MRLVRVRFTTVPRAELPPDRLSRIIEREIAPGEGEAEWQLCEDEATEALTRELTIQHVHIIGSGLWTGERDEHGAPLPPPTGGARRRITEARYEIVPASKADVLHGEIIGIAEGPEVWVWMVLEPHMSPALRDDMNIELAHAIDGGLWTREQD